MPYTSDSIRFKDFAPEKDRRIKLTLEQREEIKDLYGCYSYNQLAIAYGVSKRLIIFIVKPELLAKNKRLRAEKGGSKQYYDTEKNTTYQREHRTYKHNVYTDYLKTNKRENNDYRNKIINI